MQEEQAQRKETSVTFGKERGESEMVVYLIFE